jgi:sugar/nucleoside kinase (ribokinase family)
MRLAKIYTMGEMLVEIMRETVDSPLDEAGRFLGPYPSGAPAIFISTVAQLGHEAKIWGGVGKDRFGDVLLRRLSSDGVNCDHVAVIEGQATAVAFVAYDSAGDREFIYHIDGTPATAVKYHPEDAEVPDYFHVMGCSLMASEIMCREICVAVVDSARQGSRISFDPNLRPELLGDRSIWDVAGTVMDNCSVFLPGLDELRLFCKSYEIKDCVNELFDRFPGLEIIHLKLGKKGSEIYNRETSIAIPIFPIERVHAIVDPTGAGDSFDGAFLCALAEGKTLKDAGDYAARAGALNSIAFGPMEGSMKDINKKFF